ncbi:2-hydroxyacid dehydrogenase [Rhodobacteraceae bacterium CCMM004]|nr:2-hydroxyacid dehydrogenase [Rhodobacteraceae bacterium CCMM004]
MTDTLLAIGTYNDWDIEPMRADHDLEALAGTDDLLALPEARRAQIRAVAFKGHAPFGAAHMDALPNLGLIANYGVGYDAIDVAAAQARGIAVTNTPDVLNDDVADLAVAMLIAQSRQMVQGDAHVRSGAWSERPLPLNRKVSGGRAGILGLGRIGRDIADRLAAFKMDIHYWSRSEKETPGWTHHPDPVALAEAVDYLIVALVGGAETEGMVDARVIDALGPDGLLVNISRGSTVDEGALIEALATGRLRGAALDVFRSEPDLDRRFLALDNVLLQPHQGSGTVETRRAMGQLQRDNVAAFFAGRDLPTSVT